ncbi:hypothetical protein [Wenyingzhuangia sp. IMCC45574]
MDKLHIYIFITSILLLQSCISLYRYNIDSIQKQNLTKENINLLNGQYNIKADSIIGCINDSPGLYNNINSYNDLTVLLRLKKPENFWYDQNFQKITGNVEVKLQVISSRKILAKVYRDDKLVFEEIIKGKIYKGYFYLNAKILIIPFMPILYVHQFERTRIAISANFLKVEYSINELGFSIGGGGRSKGSCSSIYRKK